jgi:hypothetical protein
MTATERAFQMNNDPVWQEKYRLMEAIIRDQKAREAARETAKLRKRLERIQAGGAASAAA